MPFHHEMINPIITNKYRVYCNLLTVQEYNIILLFIITLFMY